MFPSLEVHATTKVQDYFKQVLAIFKTARMTGNETPTQNADKDACFMVAAPIFLVAGGGYSRLIRLEHVLKWATRVRLMFTGPPVVVLGMLSVYQRDSVAVLYTSYRIVRSGCS